MGIQPSRTEIAVMLDNLSALVRNAYDFPTGECARLSVVLALASGKTAGVKDSIARRRVVLRALQREHYPLMSRTLAAAHIATDWRNHAAGDFIVPGSKADFFERLARGGAKPLSARTIGEDLDLRNR